MTKIRLLADLLNYRAGSIVDGEPSYEYTRDWGTSKVYRIREAESDDYRASVWIVPDDDPKAVWANEGLHGVIVEDSDESETPLLMTDEETEVDAPFDPVERAEHYNAHPSGIEAIEIIRHYTFTVGSAVKYLWRAGLKKDEGLEDKEKEIQDLEKAKWYIDDRIKQLRGEV